MSIKKYIDFVLETRKPPNPVYALELMEPGIEVAYAGSRYFVIASSEFALELSKNKEALPGDRKNLIVNKNMFSERGMVFE